MQLLSHDARFFEVPECERAALQAASAQVMIENIEDLNDILPPHFHLKNKSEFAIQASARMLFWTLDW